MSNLEHGDKYDQPPQPVARIEQEVAILGAGD
jgi:hypothetical protein